MMDLKSFTQAIQQIADEKGVAKEKIIETIEMALAAAYKRDYGKRGQIVRARLDPATGKAEMRQIKIVVDESMIKSEEEIAAEDAAREAALAAEAESGRRAPRKDDDDEAALPAADGEPVKVRFNPEKHLMLDEAKKTKKDAKPGDELEFPLEAHDDFGRIAAQTAKQVIIQRIREAERDAVYGEYKEREGELVSGIVQRIEGRNVFVDVGRTVAVLPPEEQIPTEYYRVGQRVKALIIFVEKNARGPAVFLSRSHPRLLKKLFEIEVPEIPAGVVEIRAVAREPGFRSKVAVFSHAENVDPVGSLVGQKGVRVSTVIHELGGEKIDVIEWSDNPTEFIGNALSPAKVLDVTVDEAHRSARAIVPDEQLSLAIGKGGQNVRLAAKLTDWRIDVRSDKGNAPAEEAAPAEAAPEEPAAAPVSGESAEEAKG